MRILGFSKKWGKLGDTTFTTYRFPRKDKDWQLEEVVQVATQPVWFQLYVYKDRGVTRELIARAQEAGCGRTSPATPASCCW